MVVSLCDLLSRKALSRRDYERLPSDTKAKAVGCFESIKEELHDRFSLRFLSLDGRWDELTVWKFLALPEDHYVRLIKGSRHVTYRYKSDLLRRIATLYKLATPKQGELAGLENWIK